MVYLNVQERRDLVIYLDQQGREVSVDERVKRGTRHRVDLAGEGVDDGVGIFLAEGLVAGMRNGVQGDSQLINSDAKQKNQTTQE